jgi:hypothetical protein
MKPSTWTLAIGFVCAHAGIRVSHADPPAPPPSIETSSYNVFDLIAGHISLKLKVSTITSVELKALGSLPCKVTPKPTVGVPHSITLALHSCNAILQQVIPGSLEITTEVPHGAGKPQRWKGTISFDPGIEVVGKTSYDPAARTLDLTRLRAAAVPGAGDVAFYDVTSRRWTSKTLGPSLDIPYQRPNSSVFAKLPDGLLLGLPLGGDHGNAGPFDCELYTNHAALSETYRALDYQPYCIDQANPSGSPVITLNQHNILPPNNYQLLIVRHWDNVVPVLTFNGAGIGLAAPSFVKIDSSGKAEVTSQTGALQGRSVLESHPEEGYEISAFLLAPHAPGYSHLTLTFTAVAAPAASESAVAAKAGGADDAKDPGKDAKDKDAKDKGDDSGSSAPANAHTIGIDLITDEAYAGALRLGVSQVFARTHRYSSFTPSTGAQAQIERIDSRPLEVTLGYSIYGDIFTGGRTYNIAYGGGALSQIGHWLLRHTGLYAGVGVLGYEGGKLDYLRSLYLGVELDVNRNIAFGFAWNLRRRDQLADAMVGGPVPASGIQTRSDAQSTCAVFLNVTTEFFEFAKGAVKL